MKRQCIEFMIAHDGGSRAGFAHRAHDVDRVANPRASINKVAAEEHFAVGMAKSTGLFRVPQLVQQFYQLISVAVNVTDNVVHVWEDWLDANGIGINLRSTGSPKMPQAML